MHYKVKVNSSDLTLVLKIQNNSYENLIHSPLMKFIHDVLVDHVWHVTGDLPSRVSECLVIQPVNVAQGVSKCVKELTTSELWHSVLFLGVLIFFFLKSTHKCTGTSMTLRNISRCMIDLYLSFFWQSSGLKQWIHINCTCLTTWSWISWTC